MSPRGEAAAIGALVACGVLVVLALATWSF